MTASYKTWLVREHLGDDTPEGDLAADVQADRTFPGHATKARPIFTYLQQRNACLEVLETFASTWWAYRRATRADA